ncbi:MAG: molybdenum cofactor guanylyltransferase [SAR202 cluster bacterium]|jgi:molybdopterin-guanine dinucleotide biosynthesis protein A|nr:molybdenum cofactor guanylyltransferase [SAR202 cluster bacterium]MDP6662690.1 molybdenum cofactor guanylyltransferase [SAR202 cluster bacterium]MDP6799459.1 molybdenum cofactor guanylyltransferase [SAR202 cluster bacterium]
MGTRRSSEITGVVLAGGMSRRLGRNKALEQVAGRPLISRVLDSLAEVADQAVVVFGDTDRSDEFGLPSWAHGVLDVYPGKGALGGIYSGLNASRTDWCIVVACDMPFLNLRLLDLLLDNRDGYDAVIPYLDDRPEPTHAAYSRTCLPHIENRLDLDQLKIASFFGDVRINRFPQSEVEAIDPDRLSFFNVNTQADLDRARTLAASERVVR